MSLDKTLTDQYRLPLKLDKFPVSNSLPAHFESIYPKFVEFLSSYYQNYDGDDSPAKFLNELQHNRDLADVTPHLLRFIGEELFLGKDYTESFSDKESAIQISNLLYRSKGTSFSIEQFFRIFFGFDINIRYGRNEIFTVGDPAQEKLLYTSEYRSGGTDANGNDVNVLFPGDRLKFNFQDGAIQVYALALTPKTEVVPSLYIRETPFVNNYIDDEGQTDYIIRTAIKTTYNVWFLLRENIDYVVEYDSKTIVFIKAGLENSLKKGDPWLDHLAEFGEIAPPSRELDYSGEPFGPMRYPKSRIETTRRFPAGSPIGADIGDKRITDNAYYQMFSILIKTPIAVNAWKDVYKDFIHPSGMYLAGEVLIESVSSVGLSALPTSTEMYDLDYEGVGTVDDFAYGEVTEFNVRQPEVKPEPSEFVFNMSDGDLTLPQTWDGQVNGVVSLVFNRREMNTEDQWLFSATVGGLKHGLVFPAATPNRLVYRYVEQTTLNIVDVDAIQNVLLGTNHNIQVLVTSTQIFVSSDGINSVYSAAVEYYPRVDAIGDNFYGSIWEVVLQDATNRSNVIQYPMREGSGDIFKAYADNGNRFVNKDIPLPSSDRGAWSAPLTALWKGNNISVPEWTSINATGFGINLYLSVSTFSGIESLLLWDNNNQTVGLKVTSENVLEYVYQDAGGTTTVQIDHLQVDESVYVQIQHSIDRVTITSLQNGVSSTIESLVTPLEIAKINYITGTALTATVWNLELRDGANSRYYPMQDGTGTTMLAYDQFGIAAGASQDAIILGSGEWVSKNFLESGGA